MVNALSWAGEKRAAFQRQALEDRAAQILAVLLCIVGLLLRIYFFAINRSLWLDEALLANNIVRRSFAGLLAPLGQDQVAPLAFLMLEKLVITALGARDWALRLVPLAAGLISVPLMYAVARTYVGGWASLPALALFAFSTTLLNYSAEVKQYSTDVFAALFLLWYSPKCFDRDASPRAFVILSLLGSFAMSLSQPAVFIMGGVGLTLFAVVAVRRDWKRLVWIAIPAAFTGATLVVLYAVSLRYAASNTYLLRFWRSSFAPLPPWANWNWYGRTWNGLLEDLAGMPGGPLMAAIFAIGLYVATRRKWEIGLALLLSMLLTLIASSLQLYPLRGRLLLFMLPVLFLAISAGADGPRRLLIKVNRPASWVLFGAAAVYLLALPIGTTIRNVQAPPRPEDIKPLLTYVRQHWLKSDFIYVFHGAEAAFVFYVPKYGFKSKDYMVGTSARDDAAYARDADSLKGRGRVWLLFTYDLATQADEEALFLQKLDKIGVKEDQLDAGGSASVFLYALEQ